MNDMQEFEETRAIVEAARSIGNGIPWQGFKIAVAFYQRHHQRVEDAPADALANVAKSE